MEKKNKIIILSSAVIFVVLVGAILYFQQRTINQLKSVVMPVGYQGQASPESAGAPQKALNDAQVAQITAQLADNTQVIEGKITDLADNSMKVEANVVDIPKIGDAASPDQLPRTKKTYSVSVNDKTEFPNFRMQDFRVGQTVEVFTNDLIYKTDNLTAVKIIPFSEQPVQGAALPKPIGGKVEKIDSNSITFKSFSSDQKEYVAKITGDTKLFKIQVTPIDQEKKKFNSEQVEIKLSDIHENDAISAVPAGDPGGSFQFDAASITVIPLALPKN